MSIEFNPKVSIIIPVYNGSNYLREAIECALSQDYSNFEVIVVNDGSNDNGETENIALSYGDRIKYILKENGGVSSALNLGIKNMTGEYFSWLSHDDRYEPGKLKNSVDYLSSFDDKEKLIVMCSAHYINSCSERISDINIPFKKNTVYTGIDVIEYLLKHKTLNACSMLIPKKAFDECGCFNEDLRYNQDALMFYEIFSRGYCLAIDTDNNDVSYRLHANQTSKTRRDLLVRDSYEMAKIIAPTFAKLSTKELNLLKFYAKRNARHDLRNAVNHCIEVGKEEGIFSNSDIMYIRTYILLGKCRNILKTIYHMFFFRK